MVWLAVAGFVTVLRYLLGWVFDGEASWAEAAAYGAVTSLAMVAVAWLTPDFPGGRASEKATQRAISSGTVPPDADPAELRTGLLHVKRLLRTGRRWAVPGLLLVTALCAFLFALLGFDGVALLVTGLCAVSAAVTWVVFRWRLRRVDRLLAELDAHPDAERSPS